LFSQFKFEFRGNTFLVARSIAPSDDALGYPARRTKNFH